MPQDKERTVLNPSVAAEGEQPLTNHGTSIPDDVGGINNETVKSAGGKKNRLKTVSMTELYSQVYVSRPPIIGGLLYPGTYILAGAPKLGKSFLMAQLAYYVSTGTDMWGFPVQKGQYCTWRWRTTTGGSRSGCTRCLAWRRRRTCTLVSKHRVWAMV